MRGFTVGQKQKPYFPNLLSLPRVSPSHDRQCIPLLFFKKNWVYRLRSKHHLEADSVLKRIDRSDNYIKKKDALSFVLPKRKRVTVRSS
jgi:hypothetical protein